MYRKLGRERFLQFITENPDIIKVAEARKRLKEWEQKHS